MWIQLCAQTLLHLQLQFEAPIAKSFDLKWTSLWSFYKFIN